MRGVATHFSLELDVGLEAVGILFLYNEALISHNMSDALVMQREVPSGALSFFVPTINKGAIGFPTKYTTSKRHFGKEWTSTMASPTQNDDGAGTVSKPVAATLIKDTGTPRKSAESGSSIPPNPIPIAQLSMEDDPDGRDTGPVDRRCYDGRLEERGDEKGALSSNEGSHKYSTRRNLSNT